MHLNIYHSIHLAEREKCNVARDFTAINYLVTFTHHTSHITHTHHTHTPPPPPHFALLSSISLTFARNDRRGDGHRVVSGGVAAADLWLVTQSSKLSTRAIGLVQVDRETALSCGCMHVGKESNPRVIRDDGKNEGICQRNVLCGQNREHEGHGLVLLFLGWSVAIVIVCLKLTYQLSLSKHPHSVDLEEKSTK